MDNRKFEESFKDAFEGAEISPSESVWTNIELDLEKAEGGRVKRRLLFYKLLAAASITFALAVAGVGYYMVTNDSQTELASTREILSNTDESSLNAGKKSVPTLNDNDLFSESKALTPSDANPSDGQRAVASREAEQHASSPVTRKGSTTEFSADGKQDIDNTFIAATKVQIEERDRITKREDVQRNPMVPIDVSQDGHSQSLIARGGQHERKLPAFYNPPNPKLNLDEQKPDPGELLLAKLALEEMKFAAEDKKEKKGRSERLWTSVGFAAGGFSGTNSAGGSQAAFNTLNVTNPGLTRIANDQAKVNGAAYSFGVNVGTKLSDRWILQGGLNYLTQSSDYVATSVAADNTFKTVKADAVATNQSGFAVSRPDVPFSVNNNVQFFSVPVQAGYLVLNNKLGLQVNAGVSTDLFLQNTLTPEADGLDQVTQDSGTDSPYRTVNFSGLMGTEVSYKFGQHYRLSLNPGIRYPLNSVYKSEIGIQSNPLTFDVGLRFRYIFH